MFGMGFTEILLIAVIAILFLGPDKLPSTMVNVAKFFRQVKTTIGGVKESIEQEMNISDLKEEALSYKKELLETKAKLTQATDVKSGLSNLTNDILDDFDDKPKIQKPKKEVTDV